MISSSLLFILLPLPVAALFLLSKALKVGSRPAGYPPGPPTVPLLGNLHLMPTSKPHLQLQKWAKEYGPIYSLILGTKTMIVLSSDTAVKDLLDKRSGNYSDRPDMFIAQKIASGNLRMVVMRYGENWRMIHRTIHSFLNIKAAVSYVPYQELESTFLLGDLLDTPNDLLHHVRRFTHSLSTQMIYGYRCVNKNDPNLRQLFEGFEKWGELAGSSSAQLVDLYPFLQKLPDFLAPNVNYAKGLFTVERKSYVGHWMKSKQALDSGKSLPCFCNDIYQAQTREGFDDDLAGYICGSLLEAGSDTTAATLYAFVQATLVWPEVQRKAQEEIDRVVGLDRLPTMDDYESLPYIRWCVKESLRWMPTAILGVPHAALREDKYMGYTIPQGATVINNVWAIHMDPDRSDEPRVFKPERFIGDNTTLFQSAIGDTKKRDNFVFGAGRRMCQGIHIAERSLFLGISRLMWSFNFFPIKDFKYDIEDLVGGLTVQPNEYPAHVEPRSMDKVKIIRESVAECEKLLDPHTLQWNSVPAGMAFSTWMPDNTAT
ncbi:cytochrome P450 oxidoreductase [Penicillium longicatenatum]|uniref:cytochrome P450 oxidoreductase n=1 Tax=Penicillium longicatenatum TaxID=1561947 RepID=UPI0025469472|nr:cytochrome P450 oxidoreductase [Penicillium longicatenatum]KAJ5631511.1 cytochrome P450 oxidoreductase [Penicillium longicatenatum]